VGIIVNMERSWPCRKSESTKTLPNQQGFELHKKPKVCMYGNIKQNLLNNQYMLIKMTKRKKKPNVPKTSLGKIH
jgi:hypothetical protein